MIVDREEERLAFPLGAVFGSRRAILGGGREFAGTLTRLGDVRIASGKDFDASGV